MFSKTPELRRYLQFEKVLRIGTSTKPSSPLSVLPPSFELHVFSSFVNKYVPETVALDLFHARLGHTSVSKLVHVDSCKHQNATQFSCDSCSLAKQSRLPFPIRHTKSPVAFELIHVDLWGPYTSPALNGAHSSLP